MSGCWINPTKVNILKRHHEEYSHRQEDIYKPDHFSSFTVIITHRSSSICILKIINGPIITYIFPQYFRNLMCVGMLRKSQKVSVYIHRSLEIFENLILRRFRNAALYFRLYYVNFSAVMFIPY